MDLPLVKMIGRSSPLTWRGWLRETTLNWLSLPEPHPGPIAILGHKDHTGGFEGAAHGLQRGLKHILEALRLISEALTTGNVDIKTLAELIAGAFAVREIHEFAEHGAKFLG